MTRKQLQSLITAGVFSAALLSGAAYADDAGTNAAEIRRRRSADIRRGRRAVLGFQGAIQGGALGFEGRAIR